MSSIIIEYDLRQPGRDYDALYSAIKSYEAWAHVTESTWLIKTEDSCVQVRDALKQKMDTNDRLFVGKLTGEAAWKNVICGSDKLKESL